MPITEQELRNHFGRNRPVYTGAPVTEAPKRFAQTFCSQCGGEFGPGNSGYSHCEDHQTPSETCPRCENGACVGAPDDHRCHEARPAPTIRTAFSDLLVALADTPPTNIIGEADSTDLDERAEHLQRVGQAVEKYYDAVLIDAKHRTSGLKFDVNVMGILSDTNGDLVGTFRIAAEQMREQFACWCELEHED